MPIPFVKPKDIPRCGDFTGTEPLRSRETEIYNRRAHSPVVMLYIAYIYIKDTSFYENRRTLKTRRDETIFHVLV